MKEIRDIIKAYDAATAAGLRTALATVVQVEGSSYRREGARMLITEEGRLTGAISGGCLEGDALRKALLVMEQQSPALVTYDTTDEDDARLGLGLGCNGVIHILIEPIADERKPNAIDLLKAAAAGRHTSVLITRFSLSERKAAGQGSCLLLNGGTAIHAASAASPDCAALLPHTREALRTGACRIMEAGGYTAFIEVLKPPVALCIAGAGNDAMPLVEMAAVLGWDITLIDGRPAYATAARFPRAGRLLVARPEEALRQLESDACTAVVLMTHNYNYDLAMLRGLLPAASPYIGVLGPRKKLERMLDDLRDAGFPLTENLCEKVHGPTGLDIGALTSEEIALSILAEIQSVLARKDGLPLRQLKWPIHTLAH